MPNAIKYKEGNLTGSLQKGNVALGISVQGPTSTTGWYSGLTPDLNRYVVYKTDASNTPRIFYPADDSELIRLAKQEGATGANTGSAAAVLAWIGTQSNLIAANFEYEDIVTDGLVFNADAGFVGSYPTINTTLYDLSGNSYNGTLTNGPTFNSANSGSIVFDGIDDFINLPINSSFNTPSVTFEVWANLQSINDRHIIYVNWTGNSLEVNSNRSVVMYNYSSGGQLGAGTNTGVFNWDTWTHFFGFLKSLTYIYV
jgi:hypothetical protein